MQRHVCGECVPGLGIHALICMYTHDHLRRVSTNCSAALYLGRVRHSVVSMISRNAASPWVNPFAPRTRAADSSAGVPILASSTSSKGARTFLLNSAWKSDMAGCCINLVNASPLTTVITREI